MSGIHLYDDAQARTFEPFALTRPVSELVAGVATIRDRWIIALQLPALGRIGAPHLAEFDEPGVPRATERIAAGTVVANARFAPKLRPARSLASDPVARAEGEDVDADVWTADGRVVAVRVSTAVDADHFEDGTIDLEALVPPNGRRCELNGWWLDAPWDLVRLLPMMLPDDIAYLHQAPMGPASSAAAPPPEHAVVLGQDAALVARDVVVNGAVIQRGAEIEPHVVFDTTGGPIYVGPGSHIRAFTRLAGPCYIGRATTIMGGDVTGCSIGDHCKVRGEISTTIVAGYSNKGHDGFVGHSYLGRWVNLGAGTITSNLKNTYGTVAMAIAGRVRDTGLQFLGTLFGDHAKTGIGMRLTTGCVVGAGANVYDRMPPKTVPPFAWGSGEPYDRYLIDKFLDVARRMMARRQVELSDRMARTLEAAFREAQARAAAQRRS